MRAVAVLASAALTPAAAPSSAAADRDGGVAVANAGCGGGSWTPFPIVENLSMEKSRTGRILLLAAGVLAVAFVAAAFGVRRIADARWAEMQQWMTTARAQWEARDFRRPALWGETREGRAFDRYDEAIAIAAGLRSDHDRLVDLMHRPAELADGEAAALRARWAPALAAVRQGAHLRDGRVPRDFDDGLDDQILNLLDTRWIANMAVIEARELLADGRGMEAVKVSLDAAAFGADVLRTPLLIEQMIGCALLAIGTSGAWPDERLRQLPPEALELLADGLRRLDESLPPALPLDGEALFMAHALAGDWARENGYGPLSAWRYGFSTRWMYADAVLRITDMLAPPDGAEITEVQSSPNPIVSSFRPVTGSAHEIHLRVVARLRLLRMAVDARLGREPAPLPDPLADGPIRVIETEKGLRLRAGSDERSVALPSPR